MSYKDTYEELVASLSRAMGKSVNHHVVEDDRLSIRMALNVTKPEAAMLRTFIRSYFPNRRMSVRFKKNIIMVRPT